MLTLLLLVSIVTTFTTSQGGIVHMTLPDEPGVKSMQLMWENHKVPFGKAQGKWETIAGIDVDAKPGEHQGEIVVTFDDGHSDKRPVTLRVQAVKYPTTELTVDDQYVELSKANLQRSTRETGELNGIYAKMTPEILWTKPFRTPIPDRPRDRISVIGGFSMANRARRMQART